MQPISGSLQTDMKHMEQKVLIFKSNHHHGHRVTSRFNATIASSGTDECFLKKTLQHKQKQHNNGRLQLPQNINQAFESFFNIF